MPWKRPNRRVRDNPQSYPENNFPVVGAMLAGLIALIGLAIAFGWVNP